MGCCGGDDTKKAAAASQKGRKVTRFEYGGPAVSGDSYAVFDDGRCYRVEVGRRQKKWYIYNDTLDMEIHINFTFEAVTAVHPPKHGRTAVKVLAGKRRQCTTVVYPLETIPFVKFGRKTEIAYRASNMAQGLTPGYIERVNLEAVEKYQHEMQRVVGIAGVTHTDEELLYKCRKSKIPFVDMSFLPARDSLARPQDRKAVAHVDEITWKRPQDSIPAMAHRQIKLFRRGIEPEDVGQGQLGDCWLMSSIAVVADSQTMIRDIFRHPVSKSKRRKEQKAGGYRVYLNKRGWWHNVIVDSYLPTYNCAVYFGHSAADPYELWVSLLEKAYAKIHGSYASIIGGTAMNALRDLTGFPVYNFNDTWGRAATEEAAASEFFKALLRYRRKGYLISINTPGHDNSSYNAQNQQANTVSMEEQYNTAGLRMGHAYSVLKVRQFLIPRVKLLKIRNPWGTGEEWRGAWGKGSDKWKKHSLVRRACKPSTKSDGTFWMEWKDAIQYFDGGGVCMVKKAWYDYRFQGQFVGIYPSFCLKIELKKKQKAFFTISQKDRRLMAADDPEQLYKGLLISVSAHDPQSGAQELVALSTSNPEVHPTDVYNYVVARDLGLEIELDPKRSPYYVIPRIMVANRNGPKHFGFGLLTPNKSTMKELRVSFVQLPESCATFTNASSFAVDGEQPLHMQFQYKKRGGAPRLKEGITIFGSCSVREEYPFPY